MLLSSGRRARGLDRGLDFPVFGHGVLGRYGQHAFNIESGSTLERCEYPIDRVPLRICYPNGHRCGSRITVGDVRAKGRLDVRIHIEGIIGNLYRVGIYLLRGPLSRLLPRICQAGAGEQKTQKREL